MSRHRKVHPHEVDLVAFKARFNGTLPRIKGSKYRYPPPDDEDGWRCLLAKAYTHRRYALLCAKNGRTAKRHYKYEYLLYHARPDQVKRRTTRNRDRRTLSERGEIPTKHHEVHHMDSKNLRRPVALTPRQHDLMHTKAQESGTKKAVRKKSGAV
jgi:hypothetical protein